MTEKEFWEDDDLEEVAREFPKEGLVIDVKDTKERGKAKKEKKAKDVPFVKKEIKPSDNAEEAERGKEILLALGFHEKKNGDPDKVQYITKEGEVVVGRTFSTNFPTGKFWALDNNNFLKEDEIKKLKIVQTFYDVREGKKNIKDAAKELEIEEVPFTSGRVIHEEALATLEKGEMTTQTPNDIISEAQGMATALYHVVEKQHLYMEISGKKYLQLEAWQLLGKFCNVHGIIETVQPVEYFGLKGFEARAVVKDSEGVVHATAEAVCMDDELNWKDKPLYQLKSMAQTRSLSKAYRSALSFIVSIAGYSPTPLEEMSEV